MVKGLYGIAVALIACAAPAVAQTSGSIAIGTDYVSRGTSQTFGSPAVMLYGEHQFKNGFYVAGFAANVDFDNKQLEDFYGDDGTYLEADVFVGKRGTVGKFNYDVALMSINYLGAKKTPGYNPSGNWNMVELHGTLSRTFNKTTVTVDTGITPDYFNNYGKSIWGQVAVSHAVSDKLAVGGAFGRQQFFEDSETDFPKEFSNYNTWNLGATYNLRPNLSVDMRYYDNDTKIDLGPIYKPRVVATLRRAF